jgi:hypothetical protein
MESVTILNRHDRARGLVSPAQAHFLWRKKPSRIDCHIIMDAYVDDEMYNDMDDDMASQPI